jgi:predicted signal transduction protein with EAL and GGDEF domain
LELDVVAEGVEDADSYAFLAGEGCDIVQGYHISKPLPADEFTTWLHDTGGARDDATDAGLLSAVDVLLTAPGPVAHHAG